MPGEVADDRRVFLSTLSAGRSDRRLALIAVLVSAAIFVAVAPFAKVQLPRVDAFIPVYQSAFVVNDLITAVLLFGQFSILRSRALLVLATGYLLTAFMAIAHALSFPGLFAPTGLLGAGPQSTAWLYMFWHGAFPLLVIAYALLKGRDFDPARTDARTLRAGPAILASIAAALLVVCGLTALATAGQELLPPIMQGHRYTPAMIVVVSSTWALSLIALAVLWRKRPHSVLDLWLMVVLCAWLFDIALAAVLNAGRFDLGFYAGRIYGLLAASFVLVVLLLENSVLYARLVETHESERRKSAELAAAHERERKKSAELAMVNKELDSFSHSVAHDLRAPLRAVNGFARMLESGYGDKLDAEGRRLLGVVRTSAELMGKLIEALLNFARLGRQPLKAQPIEMEQLVNLVIEELRAANDGRSIDFAVGKLGTAMGDPALLRQVLANLLGNAVKFTRDRNPAIVEVGVRTDLEPAGANVYYVKDNGPGFDMRHYEKLFGVFQRLHTAEEFEGTGIGLSIVQRVVTRHGGRVWADSKLGEGATFYFTLQET